MADTAAVVEVADSTAVVAVDPTAAAEATAVEAVDRRLKDLSLAAQAFWPALFLFFLHRFPGLIGIVARHLPRQGCRVRAEILFVDRQGPF